MKKQWISFILSIWIASAVNGQCPTINDGFGVASNNPYFIGCSGADYTVFVQPNGALGQYTIDWGDGSSSNGTSLLPPNFVSHTYTATVDTFNLTITDITNGCAISGVVVMEEPVNASIQIPIGGVTQTCAPAFIDFINSSTDISPTTVFTWTFGDGSPPQIFGPGNAGQTVSHQYLRNTVNCNTVVTLEAENYCSFGNPTTAQFSPIQIYDLDDALINASAQTLCYPDTTVTFTNATNKNCVPQGNVQQRYEYWNFGDYWGLGYDSIINWQPFDPPARPGYPIDFPGIGSYTIMMIDSNMCGQDTAYITIDIIPPPTAAISSNRDTICAGEGVTFFNNSVGGANVFNWNFDKGQGWQNFNGTNKNRNYPNQGVYDIGLAVDINGGSPSCRDTAYVPLVVEPSPVADFVLDNNEGCDSVAVSIADNSQNVASWSWNYGNGSTATGNTPPSTFYNSPGNYTIQLNVVHPNGCVATSSQQVTVHQSPVAGFLPNNVCQQVVASFQDLSSAPSGDPIINWDWNFGNGATSSLQNPTSFFSTAGNYNFQLIVATQHCADAITDTLTVEPKPVAQFSVDQNAGCPDLAVQFTNGSTGAVNYQWSFGDSSSSSILNPIHTYTNSQFSDTTYQTTLIAETAFGCRDTTAQAITVYGVPQAGMSFNSTPSCGPVEVQFGNLSVGAISYAWDFGDSSSSVAANPAHIFNNQTLFITDYQVELVATSSNGCTDTVNDVVTVYPEPIFPFNTIPDSGCSPLTVTFPALIGAVVYNWDFGDGSTATGQQPTHTFINSTTNNQQFQVQLVATSSFGCIDTTYEDVIVYPKPTADFTLDTNQGCSPTLVSIANTSIGSASFSWTFGDGQTDTSNAPNLAHVYDNNSGILQQYLLSLVATTPEGCADTLDSTITVFPELSYTVPQNDTGCHPLAVDWQVPGNGGSTFQWQFGDGATANLQNPQHTFLNTALTNDTTYQAIFEATSVYGCTYNDTTLVTVYPVPIAQFSQDVSDGCTPLQVSFTNASLGAAVFDWQFSNGNVSSAQQPAIEVFTNSLLTPDSSVNQLIVSNVFGCSDSTFDSLVVFPEVSYQLPVPDTGCHPLSVSWQVPGTGGDFFQWQFGDGAIVNQQNPQHTYANTNHLVDSVYKAIFSASSIYGCSYTDSIYVQVYPVPLAQFSQDISAACTPTMVSFTNNSIGGNQFNWQFSNGNSSTIQQPAPEQFVNAFLIPDSTQNTLVVTNMFGCSDQTNDSLVVYPEVSYQLPTPDTGCHPLAINWQASGVGGNFFQWQMGDGTIINQQNPSHTYQNLSHVTSAFYKAKFLATSTYGCTYEDSIQVQVYPVPLAQFTQSAVQGCTPVSVGFTNMSIGATSFNWSFGNGNSSVLQSPNNELYVNAFASPDSVNNTLVVTNPQGCSNSTSNPFIVFPDVVASFTADTVGCHPFTSSFVNASSGATSFVWDFDNGNISSIPAPSETFMNLGSTPKTYLVEMYATSQYGCSDTATQQILVNVKPTAGFGITGTSGCSPYEIGVMHNSQNADFLDWDFGDGTSLSSGLPMINHTYVNGSAIPLTYNLQVVASTVFGCADTAIQPIVVNPAIEANFLSDTIGCSPLVLNTTDISIGAATYDWSYGNGNGSNLSNPVITYENTTGTPESYTLQLIANSAFGCSDTVQKDITVFPEPIAQFSANPQLVLFPQTSVGIVNQTIGSWSYNWDFGDGTTSSIEQPDSVVYPGVGTYRILLQISNDYCSDTSSKVIRIVPPPPIASFIGSGEGCVPVTIDFKNNSQYASGFLWEFGDGNSSGLSNPSYTYFQPGIYTVRLVAEGPNGIDEMLKVDSVIVHPKATAQFDATPEIVSVPGQGVQFFNLSTNASSYTWSFGDGNQSEEEQPNYFYQKPGEYYPQLIAQNDFNCPDTFTVELPITAEADGRLDFPNVFTPDPNGSSENGYYSPGQFNATIFHPVMTGVEQYHLTIFNRWGELVFETRDQNQGWNGYYRGDIAQQDAYVWKADVVFINGEEETMVGNVTLLR